MVKITEKNGSKKLYQWDLNREITISADADVVDFAHKNDAEAVRVKPVNKDGVLTASIPNSLLQSSQPIVVWLVKGDQTIYGQVLPVIPRQKPADYVETEDDVLSYVALEKRVAELEKNAGGNSEETDPTVPDWAKQPEKPTYTAQEVGAATESELFAFAVKTETEVAESLNITDCADYKMLGLKIFGKAVQFATSGKNLFDADAIYRDYKISNGIYKMDCGTATLKEMSLNDYSGSQISFKCYIKCPVGLSYVCAIIKNNGKITKYGTFVNKGVTGYSELSVKVEAGDALSITYGSKNGETDTDIELSELQLEIASATTDYEPYTGSIASPNPDYPQSIKITENPCMAVYGKNYYNGGDVSGELSVTVPVDRIESGTYFISADSTSTDTDKPTLVKIAFRQVTNGIATDVRIVSINRGRGACKVVLDKWVNSMTFYASDSYVDSVGDSFTFSNIQVELGNEETAYSPYKCQSVDVEHTLCAVPVSSNGTYTDADGQQWICDTVDFDVKVYTKRIKKLVLTGTEAWKVNTAYDYHYDLIVGDNLCGIYINPVLSTHYPNKRNTGMYYATNVDYAVMPVDASRIRIKDARYQSDLEGFKAMLAKKYADGDPVIIYYALASPVETALTDAELENIKKLQTYYNITRVDNDQKCPMQVQYVADTKLYIDRQINAALESATARVASLEQYVVQT